MKAAIFIKNTIVLVFTSIVLRTVGIIFRIYLADKIGSEGIGLYQLIFSVYILASTFASSGISTAVTRLVSENEDKGEKAIKKVLKKAAFITVFVATVSFVLIFFGAEIIAKVFIKDIRAVKALKILSFSLIFMGISANIRGYFLARRKTVGPSLVQMAEQVIRIITVVFCLFIFLNKGIEYSAAAVLAGDTVAEISACFIYFIIYRKDVKNLKGEGRVNGVFRKILRIALPLSGAAYVSSFLHTTENILIPEKLSYYHQTSTRGLQLFGAIRGMAMPVLFFPASFLTSLSTLLIPEISESAEKGRKQEVYNTVRNAVGTTLILSSFVAVFFWFFAYDISEILYNDSDVGYVIRILSVIVPFMYLESVCAGILKGLDQQLSMFKYNCIDSIIRIAAVIFLVPKLGIEGYLGIMIISNCFTSSFNYKRLTKVVGFRTDFLRWVIKPLMFAFLGGFLAVFLFEKIDFLIIKLACSILVQSAVFFGLMSITGELQFLKTTSKKITIKTPKFKV